MTLHSSPLFGLSPWTCARLGRPRPLGLRWVAARRRELSYGSATRSVEDSQPRASLELDRRPYFPAVQGRLAGQIYDRFPDRLGTRLDRCHLLLRRYGWKR